MNDHIKPEISSYLAGGLTESRNRQIEAHAAACEKCRNALAKARAKQARVKREALKKASSDPLPNLFLARQGKVEGIDHHPIKAPWMLIGIVLLAVIGYWGFRHASYFAHSSAAPGSESEGGSVQTSSAAVSAANPEVTPSVSPVVEAPVRPRPSPPKPPVPLYSQQEWKGTDSAIKDIRLVVVRNVGAWDKLWSEMLTGSPLPSINFDDHVVVGVFAGERPAGATIALDPIREMDEEVSVPFRVTHPEVAVSTDSVPSSSHPYLISMFSRINKKIRLTEKEASR